MIVNIDSKERMNKLSSALVVRTFLQKMVLIITFFCKRKKMERRRNKNRSSTPIHRMRPMVGKQKKRRQKNIDQYKNKKTRGDYLNYHKSLYFINILTTIDEKLRRRVKEQN